MKFEITENNLNPSIYSLADCVWNIRLLLWVCKTQNQTLWKFLQHHDIKKSCDLNNVFDEFTYAYYNYLFIFLFNISQIPPTYEQHNINVVLSLLIASLSLPYPFILLRCVTVKGISLAIERNSGWAPTHKINFPQTEHQGSL